MSRKAALGRFALLFSLVSSSQRADAYWHLLCFLPF